MNRSQAEFVLYKDDEELWAIYTLLQKTKRREIKEFLWNAISEEQQERLRKLREMI